MKEQSFFMWGWQSTERQAPATPAELERLRDLSELQREWFLDGMKAYDRHYYRECVKFKAELRAKKAKARP